MQRQVALVEEETYHLYNRGAHKRDIFNTKEDYARFLALLHLSNNTEPIHISKLLLTPKYQGRSLRSVFEEEPTDKALVDIFAYCLMPNHFHIVLRQKCEQGITIFMRRLLTGYSMYFNTKYGHSGTMFQGRFKSSYVDSEEYFRYIFAYAHLNPLGLFQADWKESGIRNKEGARSFLNRYPYSSFIDYPKSNRPEGAILSLADAPDFLKNQNDLEDLLRWQDFKDGP
ncbi:MAG: transposase [Minisyncoccia bacterium]|jgi:putative transposase